MRRTDHPVPVILCAAVIIAVAFAVIFSCESSPVRQVITDGKVVTWQTMLSSCDGDSVKAAAMSVPVPTAGSYLSRGMLVTEYLYNTLHLRFLPFIMSVVALLLTLVSPRRYRLWSVLEALVIAGTLAVSCVLSGRIPMAATGESMMISSLILTLLLLLFHSRRLTVVTLLFVSLLLAGASFLWVHPAVWRPSPALMSWWLPVHVTLMMTSYSLLILSAAAAIAGVADNVLRRLLYGGTACLAAGIVTGSLWAAGAWGRWWGWDPKETFALITLIIYVVILVCRGRMTYSARRLSTIIAVIFVVMTWIGIDSLGGLHSY